MKIKFEPVLPIDRWYLQEIARCYVDGEAWVVYSDDQFCWALPAKEWDEPTAEIDYSLWCSSTNAAGDINLCSRIARAAKLDGIYAAGICVYVES